MRRKHKLKKTIPKVKYCGYCIVKELKQDEIMFCKECQGKLGISWQN